MFFPSNTLIYGISRDGPKNFNIRTFEHMVLGQLRMGAGQAKNAPLHSTLKHELSSSSSTSDFYVEARQRLVIVIFCSLQRVCWFSSPQCCAVEYFQFNRNVESLRLCSITWGSTLGWRMSPLWKLSPTIKLDTPVSTVGCHHRRGRSHHNHNFHSQHHHRQGGQFFIWSRNQTVNILRTIMETVTYNKTRSPGTGYHEIQYQRAALISKCQLRVIFINSRASYLSIRKGWEEGFIDQKLNSFAAIWFIFDARPPWEIKLTLNFWGGRGNCLISINFPMEVTQYMWNTCFINENHSTGENDLNLNPPRHEICQKSYTAGFSGQRIYTFNFPEFQRL